MFREVVHPSRTPARPPKAAELARERGAQLHETPLVARSAAAAARGRRRMLRLWADLMILAPATANTLSKMANGNCDNLLIATYLSAKCPVYFAPAMDLDMYAHPSNQKNILTLKSYGNKILPVDKGQLASGLEGKGRMLEPQEIIENIITII